MEYCYVKLKSVFWKQKFVRSEAKRSNDYILERVLSCFIPLPIIFFRNKIYLNQLYYRMTSSWTLLSLNWQIHFLYTASLSDTALNLCRWKPQEPVKEDHGVGRAGTCGVRL